MMAYLPNALSHIGLTYIKEKDKYIRVNIRAWNDMSK